MRGSPPCSSRCSFPPFCLFCQRRGCGAIQSQNRRLQRPIVTPGSHAFAAPLAAQALPPPLLRGTRSTVVIQSVVPQPSIRFHRCSFRERIGFVMSCIKLRTLKLSVTLSFRQCEKIVDGFTDRLVLEFVGLCGKKIKRRFKRKGERRRFVSN